MTLNKEIKAQKWSRRTPPTCTLNMPNRRRNRAIRIKFDPHLSMGI